MDIKNQPTVTFKDKTSNIAKVRCGIKVGQHLAVVPGWHIYRVKKGIQLIPTSFATVEDAVEVAKWLSRVYKKYFVLWMLGDVDVFSWAKWSVPNGLIIYEMLQRLPEQATLNDVDDAFGNSKHLASKWLGVTKNDL